MTKQRKKRFIQSYKQCQTYNNIHVNLNCYQTSNYSHLHLTKLIINEEDMNNINLPKAGIKKIIIHNCNMYLHIRVQFSKHETLTLPTKYTLVSMKWGNCYERAMNLRKEKKEKENKDWKDILLLSRSLALRCISEVERRQSGGCRAISPMADSRPYSTHKYTPTVVLLLEKKE